MNNKLQIILATGAATILGFAAAAQTTPNLNTNASGAPDDTSRNVRDRDSRTQTPLDQGNDQADINTTAQIRKQIIAAKHISVDARNVKVITMNGHVTLRGPVNTAEEKRLICNIAKQVAQPGNVDDQLEVKQASGTTNGGQ